MTSAGSVATTHAIQEEALTHRRLSRKKLFRVNERRDKVIIAGAGGREAARDAASLAAARALPRC